MFIRAITFGFAALMVLGATCEDKRQEPEVIARCINPRRIDFDGGFQQACATATKLVHPVEALTTAFHNNRFEKAVAFGE